MESSTVIVALALCGLLAGAGSQQPDQERRAIVEGSNAFSTQLYQVLSSRPGNLVVSPLSAQVVLAMAWLGARGRTASQIAAGINLPPTRQQVELGFKSLLTHLQGYSTESNNTVILDIANKLFAARGLQVNDDFRSSTADNFLSDAQELDFARDAEASRRTINQWVEDKTNNKIKELIAPGSLDRTTLMVLVNALYFKGSWVKPFDPESTTAEPFQVAPGRSVNVSTMHKTAYFNYGTFAELKLKALQLRYLGDSLSMLLLLPNEVDGLGELEARFASVNLTHILEDLWKSEVVVSLPRFKVEKTTELEEPLKQLGMMDLFAPAANFSGITKQSAFVSKIVQKAFVEVTEKGTEAAAATEMEIVPYSLVSPTPEFKADHPFMFLILDNISDAILFMGRVAQPSLATEMTVQTKSS